MSKKQYIEYEDFYDMLWGDISAKAVPPEFILDNSEFIESITFDIYRIYDLDPNVSFRTVKKMIEYFLISSFKYSPNFKNNINDFPNTTG